MGAIRRALPVTSVSHDDVVAHRRSGSWRNLERVALDIIADVQKHADGPFQPKLGGGTRLMLALDHRISHDIDLFIRDPQWLGYISPRLNDQVEAMVSGYEEAADFLKLTMPDGEIDFIVRGSLLGLPDEVSKDTPLSLEPVAEVLAKKLFYRGALLTPRDLFDWWAVETMRPDFVPRSEMGRLLESKREGIENALGMLSRSQAAQTLWAGILAPEKPDIVQIASWGQEMLSNYQVALASASNARQTVRRPREHEDDPADGDSGHRMNHE